MNVRQFKRVQNKIDYISGNITPDSIQSLLLLIRGNLPKNSILRDFADFAAHPSNRGEGITFHGTKGTFEQLIKAFKYGGKFKIPAEFCALSELGASLIEFLKKQGFDIGSLNNKEIMLVENMLTICDGAEITQKFDGVDHIALELSEDKRISSYKFLAATIYFLPSFRGIIHTYPNVGVSYGLFSEPIH